WFFSAPSRFNSAARSVGTPPPCPSAASPPPTRFSGPSTGPDSPSPPANSPSRPPGLNTNNRSTSMNRRTFLQSAPVGALAASLPGLRAQQAATPRFRNLLRPGRKLRIAGIGVGGKGSTDLLPCAEEEIVALCDVDFKQGGPSFTRWPHLPRYRDYRQLFDEMGDDFDAVTVSTTDHMHFPIAMMAMERGKHVFVQKPLSHTVGEARALKAAALKTGVVTQM